MTAPTAFEATSSWCYQFARYQAIPEILCKPLVVTGQPFKLIELSREVLDTHLTKAQQSLTYPRKKSGGEMAVSASVKFYIPFIAAETGQLVNLGGGMFRLPTAEDVDEDEIEAEAVDAAEADGVDEGTDLAGWIYAFSFPMLVRDGMPFPIKVGKTSGDAMTRVLAQCKYSASFERPVLLGSWKVKRMTPTELAVHNVLKARGKWRDTAPGAEWFDTTTAEVEAILSFVTG